MRVLVPLELFALRRKLIQGSTVLLALEIQRLRTQSRLAGDAIPISVRLMAVASIYWNGSRGGAGRHPSGGGWHSDPDACAALLFSIKPFRLKKALGMPHRGADNMLRRLFKTLLLFICLGGQTFAAELKIVFSQYTPPYVFEDGSGILVDIVRTALAEGGNQMKPVYVPIERGFRMFADRQVDGTTIIQERSGLPMAYSDYFMQYHNRAFVLKSSQQVIHSVADLDGKSVVAFQYADRYLGEAFTRAVAGNPHYKELAQQQSQVHMLLLGRIDVAVMDESIFRYYRQKLISEHKVEPGQEVIGYDIFPPTRFKAAFIDPAVRDSFDKAIALMRKDGRFEAIYRKYIERYFSVEP